MNRLIDHEDVLLARFTFLYGDELPGFEGFDVLYLKPQKVSDTQAAIDPHG